MLKVFCNGIIVFFSDDGYRSVELFCSGSPLELTLFTKHPCPLCDELKADIELHFPGKFRYKEVDIEADGNKELRRKYRYDIPVLHYQDRLVCQHRIDIKQLEEIIRLQHPS